MSTFSSQMRYIALRYMEEHDVEQIDPQAVAEWAIENGLYEPQPAEVKRQFTGDLGRALRSAHHRDAQGRKTRTWHVVVRLKDGVQTSLWAPGRTAPHEHMKTSFGQRRNRIVSDCCRLKADVDSFNENHHGDQVIQLCLDFTKDLVEADIANNVTSHNDRRSESLTRSVRKIVPQPAATGAPVSH